MIWNSKYEGKTFICFTKICIMVKKKYVEKKEKIGPSAHSNT